MDYIEWLKKNRKDFQRGLENAEEQKRQYLEYIKNTLDVDIERYSNYLKGSDAAISVLEVLHGYKTEEANLG